MISITYNATELGTAAAVLERIKEKLGNLDPALNIIGSKLQDSTEERFSTSKDPDGNSWEGLADSTKKKKRGYQNKPLMTDNQAGLWNSILYKVNNRNNSVVIGSSAAYAIFHQSTQEPRTKLPRRAFLGISENDKTTILDALNEFLADLNR